MFIYHRQPDYLPHEKDLAGMNKINTTGAGNLPSIGKQGISEGSGKRHY